MVPAVPLPAAPTPDDGAVVTVEPPTAAIVVVGAAVVVVGAAVVGAAVVGAAVVLAAVVAVDAAVVGAAVVAVAAVVVGLSVVDVDAPGPVATLFFLLFSSLRFFTPPAIPPATSKRITTARMRRRAGEFMSWRDGTAGSRRFPGRVAVRPVDKGDRDEGCDERVTGVEPA